MYKVYISVYETEISKYLNDMRAKQVIVVLEDIIVMLNIKIKGILMGDLVMAF